MQERGLSGNAPTASNFHRFNAEKAEKVFDKTVSFRLCALKRIPYFRSQWNNKPISFCFIFHFCSASEE